MRDAHLPYGITANLLIRRAALEEVGGFQRGLRSGRRRRRLLAAAGRGLDDRLPRGRGGRARPPRAVRAARSPGRALLGRRSPGWTATGPGRRRGRRRRGGWSRVAAGAVGLDGAGPARASGVQAARRRGGSGRGRRLAGCRTTRPTGAPSPAAARRSSRTRSRTRRRAGRRAPPVEAARRPARLDRHAARGLRVRYARTTAWARRARRRRACCWARVRAADAPAARRLKQRGGRMAARRSGRRTREPPGWRAHSRARALEHQRPAPRTAPRATAASSTRSCSTIQGASAGPPPSSRQRSTRWSA